MSRLQSIPVDTISKTSKEMKEDNPEKSKKRASQVVTLGNKSKLVSMKTKGSKKGNSISSGSSAKKQSPSKNNGTLKSSESGDSDGTKFGNTYE
jgi:hypothetical protein